jgi:hypothetical protein
MRRLVPLVFLSLTACAQPPVEVVGLRPLSPPARRLAPKLQSLQPTLRWESFPRRADVEADREGWVNRVQRVTYDLRIWHGIRENDGQEETYPAELVYEKRALTKPEHVLETPLARETRYLWSVRARFELDGQPRVTPWGVLANEESRVDEPRSTLLPPRNYYRFATP